jgi:hypothetical protein
MKIKTVRQLGDALSDELTWRKMEIVALRMQADKKDDFSQRAILRAGVAILYSHWEGFVKVSTEFLLNFVSNQKLRNEELSDIYAIHSFKSRLATLAITKNAPCAVESFRFIVEEMQSVSNINCKNYVGTESNLSSEVFDRIAKSVGVDVTRYMHLYPFIDESIVSKRNCIAHGEYMLINFDEYKAISDRVFELINNYKTDLENIAVLKQYAK